MHVCMFFFVRIFWLINFGYNLVVVVVVVVVAVVVVELGKPHHLVQGISR